MGKIFGVLQAIQSELVAPKGQYNSFGKYNYRSAEDILEALKPILKKHNAAITLSDEIVYILRHLSHSTLKVRLSEPKHQRVKRKLKKEWMAVRSQGQLRAMLGNML